LTKLWSAGPARCEAVLCTGMRLPVRRCKTTFEAQRSKSSNTRAAKSNSVREHFNSIRSTQILTVGFARQQAPGRFKELTSTQTSDSTATMISVTGAPQSPHENTFTLFPLLPREIRDQIWKMAVQQAQQVPEGSWPVCIFTPGSAIDGTDSSHDEPRVVHQKPLSLLQVNTESRAVATKPSQRPYDPDTDVLFLPKGSLDRFYDSLCVDEEGSTSESLKSARILAIDDYEWNSSSDKMPDILRSLPNLHRLLLVFAVSSGDTDECDAVSLNKQQLARPLMMSLDHKDLDAIGFTVRYDWLPTKWKTTASRHVFEWTENIEIAISDSPLGGLSRYWNDEGRELKVPVAGSCFVGS
jgi:hypothetical protein